MKKENVKTITKKKRKLKLKGVLFLVCLFAAIIFTGYMLLDVDLKIVKVNGNDFLKDSDIIKLAGFNNKTKFFQFSSKEICNKIEEDPFVSTCKIVRKLGFKVEINIEENSPLFYYSIEDATVLSDGTRLAGKTVAGVPTMINLTTEKVLTKFIAGLSLVRSDIIHSISEIEYSPSISSTGIYIDEERFVLSMLDGNTIYINNRNLDVLNRYDTIYASLGDKKGTLYFDCDFGNYPFTEYGENE